MIPTLKQARVESKGQGAQDIIIVLSDGRFETITLTIDMMPSDVARALQDLAARIEDHERQAILQRGPRRD